MKEEKVTSIKISTDARKWLNELVEVDPHRFGSQFQAINALILEKYKLYKSGIIKPVHQDFSNLISKDKEVCNDKSLSVKGDANEKTSDQN